MMILSTEPTLSVLNWTLLRVVFLMVTLRRVTVP
jgi:hypothetical protein